jgi:hypothetical protein
MAENKFSISEIYGTAHQQDLPQKFSVPVAANKPTHAQLGSPYYKEDLSGREFFLPITLDGMVIPFAVVGITEKKTLVETALVERGGTVTEMISADDVIINIKGILLNEDGIFPEDEIVKLRAIAQKNESVELRSAFTDIFLSGKYNHKVIIKNLDWAENAGVEHAKGFSMQCKSDAIFTLEV